MPDYIILHNYDWNSIFSVNFHPQAVWDTFQNILFTCVNTYSRSFKCKLSRFNYAHNSRLRCLFNLKAALWRRLRNTGLDDSKRICVKSRYKAVSIKINAVILNQRKTLENNIVVSGDVKKFYRFVNSSLHCKKSIISLRDSKSHIISDSALFSEMFNTAFSEAFTNDNGFITPCDDNGITSTLSNVYFSPLSIETQLRDLKNSKTVTPDGFSCYTLKIFGSALVRPLMLLFEFFSQEILSHLVGNYLSLLHCIKMG